MASQQSTFKTIAVQGQKPVIAETPSDTLHIIPGDNVEITSDPSTDTLRISVKDVTEGKGYLTESDIDPIRRSIIASVKELLADIVLPPPVVEPDPPPVVDPGTQTLITAGDLTLAGHASLPNQTYANINLAIRYVTLPDGTKSRRVLVYQFDGTKPNRAGDIVEYRLTSPLKNGSEHWTKDNVPAMQEVRRWLAPSWHTRQRMLDGKYPNADNVFLGNGAWPASMYFDDRSGLLWYTWQPEYPGGAMVWPAYSAVRLVDSESTVDGTGMVSDANVYGPYYFTNAQANDFKSAAAGIIPIPVDRQAALGGKFLIVGHHCANIGSDGARGASFWLVDDLPTVPPGPGAILFPNAVHLYDTSPDSGVFPYNMRIPNVSEQSIAHASQGSYFSKSRANETAVPARPGDSVGLEVGDCLYQHDYGNIDTIIVTMDTPANGGAFVPEIAIAGAWVEPAGWKMAAGTPALSERENVFYWPQVPLPGETVRLRRTQAGTSGGAIEAIVTVTNLANKNEYPDRPAGKGGVRPVASFQYDAEHFAQCYEQVLWGGAWVKTANVEGLAYFGPISTGGQWYGAAPMWAKPNGTDTPPRKVQFCLQHPSYSNGGKTEGPRHPFFFTFDPKQIGECAAGTRKRNAEGLQPVQFFDMVKEWPGLIVPGVVPFSDDPHYGEPTFNPYGTGNSVVFDPIAGEVLVLMTNGAVWQANTIAAVFKVR
jgi:hypothetical protein